MNAKPLYAKNHTFTAPDGLGGYKLLRDVYFGEPIIADQFEAFGNCEMPEAGLIIPYWLTKIIGHIRER